MNGFRTWIRDVVEERTTLRINVSDANEVRIAYMTPITRTRPASDEVVEALTRWRNRARRFFLTQFEATVERTRNWLESVVLAADDRLFFLLYTDSGKLVGHYGFIHMDERSAEVDNLMRGESGGPPQLVQQMERAFLLWLFDTFDLEVVSAQVLALNPLALRLHYDVGFQLVAKLPLKKTECDGEIRYILIGDDGDPSPDNLYLQHLELRREAFREQAI